MRLKKVSSILLVISLLAACSIGTCFAGTLPTDSENVVPVYLTVTGEVSIDFTISENVTMTGTSSSEELTVSDLQIKNNGTMGQIEVKALEVEPASGWEIAGEELDFTNMAANSKKFSLVCDGYDFADGAKIFTEDELLIDTAVTENITFAGETCPTTNSINNTQVANVIATIAIN